MGGSGKQQQNANVSSFRALTSLFATGNKQTKTKATTNNTRPSSYSSSSNTKHHTATSFNERKPQAKAVVATTVAVAARPRPPPPPPQQQQPPVVLPSRKSSRTGIKRNYKHILLSQEHDSNDNNSRRGGKNNAATEEDDDEDNSSTNHNKRDYSSSNNNNKRAKKQKTTQEDKKINYIPKGYKECMYCGENFHAKGISRHLLKCAELQRQKNNNNNDDDVKSSSASTGYKECMYCGGTFHVKGITNHQVKCAELVHSQRNNNNNKDNDIIDDEEEESSSEEEIEEIEEEEEEEEEDLEDSSESSSEEEEDDDDHDNDNDNDNGELSVDQKRCSFCGKGFHIKGFSNHTKFCKGVLVEEEEEEEASDDDNDVDNDDDNGEEMSSESLSTNDDDDGEDQEDNDNDTVALKYRQQRTNAQGKIQCIHGCGNWFHYRGLSAHQSSCRKKSYNSNSNNDNEEVEDEDEMEKEETDDNDSKNTTNDKDDGDDNDDELSSTCSSQRKQCLYCTKVFHSIRSHAAHEGWCRKQTKKKINNSNDDIDYDDSLNGDVGYQRKEWKQMKQCPYCPREFPNIRAFAAHSGWCKKQNHDNILGGSINVGGNGDDDNAPFFAMKNQTKDDDDDNDDEDEDKSRESDYCSTRQADDDDDVDDVTEIADDDVDRISKYDEKESEDDDGNERNKMTPMADGDANTSPNHLVKTDLEKKKSDGDCSSPDSKSILKHATGQRMSSPPPPSPPRSKTDSKENDGDGSSKEMSPLDNDNPKVESEKNTVRPIMMNGVVYYKNLVNTNDVVLGRGGAAHNSPGNVWFRRLVKYNQTLYATVPKHTKLLVARSIIHAVLDRKPVGGRFMTNGKEKGHEDGNQDTEDHGASEITTHDSDLSGPWKIITYDQAIAKASQALRDASNIRKGLCPPPSKEAQEIAQEASSLVKSDLDINHIRQNLSNLTSLLVKTAGLTLFADCKWEQSMDGVVTSSSPTTLNSNGLPKMDSNSYRLSTMGSSDHSLPTMDSWWPDGSLPSGEKQWIAPQSTQAATKPQLSPTKSQVVETSKPLPSSFLSSVSANESSAQPLDQSKNDRERGLQNSNQHANANDGHSLKDRKRERERELQDGKHRTKSNNVSPKNLRKDKKYAIVERKSKRKSRCGTCKACTRNDCGKCKFCLDKPKFGGPGKSRQVCVKRACPNPRFLEVTVKTSATNKTPAKEMALVNVPAKTKDTAKKSAKEIARAKEISPAIPKASATSAPPLPPPPRPPLILPNGAHYYHQILYGPQKKSQSEKNRNSHAMQQQHHEKVTPSPAQRINGAPQQKVKLQYTNGNSFPHKLYNLIEHASWNGHGDIISWSEQGCAFIIHDHARLASELLGLHFTCHSENHAPFIRRIIDWNFLKISPCSIKSHSPGGLSFMHPFFQRGRTDNLHKVTRRKGERTKEELMEDKEDSNMQPTLNEEDGYDSESSEESLVF